MTAFLAPDPIQSTQLIPGGIVPAAGGLLFCYQAGTSTKLNTYTDPTASTARANPIVLDSGGNIPGNGEVWITSTAKFVLAPFNDSDPPVSPYWTKDNYSGINDPSQVQTEWIPFGPLPTFVSGTSFTLAGDQTAIFTPGRRVKTTNTAGTRYGTISTSVFGAVTTVTITNDSGTLDAGLSAIWYALINPVNTSLPLIVSVLNFGAKGDGVTDDTAAIQAALNIGGKIIIGGKLTYKCTSANLTFVANTELWIEQGTTLWLSTTRLTALNVNDVQIYNHGIIKSTNLNTTDAFPTDWNMRAIVEFGGTIAAPTERVGIDGPGELLGDFVTPPGTIGILNDDKRRGVLLTNVKSGWVRNLNIHNIIGEAVLYNGTSTSADIEVVGNRIKDCNFDAISAAAMAPATFRVKNNIGSNCLNGIETSIGEVRGNFMFNMLQSGYAMGGNTAFDAAPPLVFAENIGLNNGTSDFDLEGVPTAAGIVIVENNTSINAGAHAFAVTYAKTAIITGNKASGWGVSAAGNGLAVINNTNYIIDGNSVANENVAHSIGAYNISGTGVWGGGNTLLGVTVPFVSGTSLIGQTLRPSVTNTQTGATYTVAANDTSIIANRAGTVTLTLENAALVPGKMLVTRTIQAQTVVSASSNVVPLVGGAAGTAILTATAGKWALLHSDGTNWQIMAAN